MDNQTLVNLFNAENEAKSEHSNYSEMAIAIYAFLNSKAFFIVLAIVWPLLIVLGVVGISKRMLFFFIWFVKLLVK